MPYFVIPAGASLSAASVKMIRAKTGDVIYASSLTSSTGNAAVSTTFYIPVGGGILSIGGKACFSFGGKIFYLTPSGATENPDDSNIIKEKTAVDPLVQAMADLYANTKYTSVGTYTGTSNLCPLASYSQQLSVSAVQPSGYNAGQYTALVQPKDGYTWTDGSTDSKIITWSVDKAEQTGLAVAGGDNVKYSDDITLSVSGVKDSAKVTWEIVAEEGNIPAEIDPETGVLKPSAIGKVKVKATVSSTTNYNEKVIEKEITIAQGEYPSDLTIGLGNSIPFSDADKTLTLSKEVEGTVKWSLAETDSEVATLTEDGKLHMLKAGTITVTVTITDPNGNYGEKTITKQVTIERGTLAAAIPEENSEDLNAIDKGGRELKAPTATDEGTHFPSGDWTFSVAADNGIVTLEESGGTYTLKPTGKIGTATVTVSHAATDFYNAYSETFTVNTVAKDCFYVEGSDGARTAYATLQEAYDALPASGGTIYVAGNPKISATLNVTKNIQLVGDMTTAEGATPTISLGDSFGGPVLNITGGEVGIENVIIDGANGSDSLIKIDGTGTKLTLGGGTTLTNGHAAENGGAVCATGGASVTVGAGATLSNNSAKNGGAIYLEGAATTLNVEEGTFSENVAEEDGGAVYVIDGSFTAGVSGDVSFNANKATGNGGAICLAGVTDATLGAQASVNNNAADGIGDGVYLGISEYTRTQSKLTLNAKANVGDGIGIKGTGSIEIDGKVQNRITVEFANPEEQLGDNADFHYVTSKGDVDSGTDLKAQLRVQNPGYTFDPAANGLTLKETEDILFVVKKGEDDTTWSTQTFNDLQAAINYAERLGSGAVTIGIVENNNTVDTDKSTDGIAEMLAGATVPSGMELTLTSVKRTASGDTGTDVTYAKETGEGTANTLKRGSSCKEAMITVEEGAKLHLDNVILDGGAVWEGGTITLEDDNQKAGSVETNNQGVTAHAPVVVNRGEFTMQDGTTIQNNDNNYAAPGEGFGSQNYGGGVRNEGKGVFTMEGGTIQGCYAREGGAVLNINKPDTDGNYASGSDLSTNHPKVTISGGEIKNNASQMKGAAVQSIYGEAETVIEGGTFVGNYSLHDLGVLSVEEGASLTVSGGTINAGAEKNAIYLYNKYSEEDIAASTAAAGATPFVEGNHAGKLAITSGESGSPDITGNVHLDDPCNVKKDGTTVAYDSYVDVTGYAGGGFAIATNENRPAGPVAVMEKEGSAAFPDTITGLPDGAPSGMQSSFAIEYEMTIGETPYTARGIGSYAITYQQTEPGKLTITVSVDDMATDFTLTVGGEAKTKKDFIDNHNGAFTLTVDVDSATTDLEFSVSYKGHTEPYTAAGLDGALKAVLFDGKETLTAPNGTYYLGTDGEYHALTTDASGEAMLPNDIQLDEGGNATFSYDAAGENTFNVTLGTRGEEVDPLPALTLDDVTASETENKQTLTFSVTGDDGYEYNLFDEDGNLVGGWMKAVDGKVTFDGLDPDKKYTVAVRTPADTEGGTLAGAYRTYDEKVSTLTADDLTKKQAFEKSFAELDGKLYTKRDGGGYTKPASPAIPATIEEHNAAIAKYNALSDAAKSIPSIAEKYKALADSLDCAQADAWRTASDTVTALAAAAKESGESLTDDEKAAIKAAVEAYNALPEGAKALVEDEASTLLPAYLDDVKESIGALVAAGDTASDDLKGIVKSYQDKINSDPTAGTLTTIEEADELYLRAEAEVALQRAYEDAMTKYGDRMSPDGKVVLLQMLNAARRDAQNAEATGDKTLEEVLQDIVEGNDFGLAAAKEAAKKNFRDSYFAITGSIASDSDETVEAALKVIEAVTVVDGAEEGTSVNVALRESVLGLLQATKDADVQFESVTELYDAAIAAAEALTGSGTEVNVLDFAGIPEISAIGEGETKSNLHDAAEANRNKAYADFGTELYATYDKAAAAATDAERETLAQAVSSYIEELHQKRTTPDCETVVAKFAAECDYTELYKAVYGEAPEGGEGSVLDAIKGKTAKEDLDAYMEEVMGELNARKEALETLQKNYDAAVETYGDRMTEEGKAALEEALQDALDAVKNAEATSEKTLQEVLDGIVEDNDFALDAAKDVAKENYRDSYKAITGKDADETDDTVRKALDAIGSATTVSGAEEGQKSVNEALREAVSDLLDEAKAADTQFDSVKELYDSAKDAVEKLTEGTDGEVLDFAALPAISALGDGDNKSDLHTAAAAAAEAERKAAKDRLEAYYNGLKDSANTLVEERKLSELLEQGKKAIDETTDTAALSAAVTETEAALRDAATQMDFSESHPAMNQPFGNVTSEDIPALEEARSEYEKLSPEEKAALDEASKRNGYTGFLMEVEDRIAKAEFEARKEEALKEADELFKDCDGEEVKNAVKEAKEKIENTTYGKQTDDSKREQYGKDREAELDDALSDIAHAQAVQRTVETVSEYARGLLNSGNYNGEQRDELRAIADQLKEDAEKVKKEGENGKTAEKILDELLDAALEELNDVRCVATTTGDIRADKTAKEEGGTGDYPDSHNSDEIWGIVTNDASMPGGIRLVIEKADDKTTEAIDKAAKDGNLTAAEGAEFTEEEMKSLVAGKDVRSTLDIYLLKGNARITEFDGKYTVMILLPAELRDAEGLQVVYVRDDGSVEVYNTTIEDGKYLVFTTSHFSEFIILGETAGNTFNWFWIIVSVVSCAIVVTMAVFIVYFVRKKDDDEDEKREGDPA